MRAYRWSKGVCYWACKASPSSGAVKAEPLCRARALRSDFLCQRFTGLLPHRTNGLGWIVRMENRCTRDEDLRPRTNYLAHILRTDSPIHFDPKRVILSLPY